MHQREHEREARVGIDAPVIGRRRDSNRATHPHWFGPSPISGGERGDRRKQRRVGAVNLAAAYRKFRMEQLARLMEEGVVLEAGAYLDLSTALLLVRAANEQAALAIASEDVYMKEGIWVEARVKAFGRVVRA